ncbi:hypothetical protein [Mycolicibacterium peregrinum]|uniref:Uncharacterized protein n=1 Tax=Mycolicibacterium peregrinum TaxID=43304 RepID=A0A1A0W424_MYCPR|nr:hypothetical protein [Mycolicibacterium peregrinum]OBB90586.1 hypothetical protein A5779_25705 [Mycolicibacterium peregrinum]
MPEALETMIVPITAMLRSLTYGEPVASRAADRRWANDRIRRRKRFTDSCRDNRLAHQRRCDKPNNDSDIRQHYASSD